MTKDVLISIKGLHTLKSDTGEDEIEVVSPGKYYLRNGKHYVEYEETDENSGEIIKNRLSLRDKCLEIQKKGMLSAKLTFEESHKNISWYETPYGGMMAGVDVAKLQVKESEDLIEILVDYVLEANYEHVANCRIRIRIMAKDSGQFHL